MLDRIGEANRALVLDLSAVPFVDSTAARTLASLAQNLAKRGAQLYLAGASPNVRRDLARSGLSGIVHCSTIDEALALAHRT